MKNSVLLFLISVIFTSSILAQSNSLCVPSITFGDKYSGDKLTKEKLLKVKDIKVKCYTNPNLIYEVVSYDLVVVPKEKDAVKWSIRNNKLDDNQLEYLAKVDENATIYIDNAKVKSPDGNLILDMPGYAVSVVK